MKPLSMENCCSREQLIGLLDGQLGQYDSDLALSHIEHCDVCPFRVTRAIGRRLVRSSRRVKHSLASGPTIGASR